MSKIKEIIVEPNPLYVNSNFTIKIKVQRGLTFKELKDTYTFNEATQYSFGELKGD